MNQTKLDELIKKWENNFKKVDGPGLPLEEWSAYWAINEFIKDLKSLKSEQEVKMKKGVYYESCPYCSSYGSVGLTNRYCSSCGKKIKWID